MLKKLLRILVLGISMVLVYRYLQEPRTWDSPSAQKPAPRAPKEPPPPASFSMHHPRDFNEAKSILRKLYAQGEEIYCGCRYDLERKDRIDTTACGYKGQGARSRRIEWEHVVPASVFGQRFTEWKSGHPSCVRQGHMEKGRNCARETSEEFARMEADLYNLLPSLGELNAARSNYPYGEVAGEPRKFGSCDFEVEHKIAEPRREIRGDLARIYFYMDARYPGFAIVNKSNEGLLSAWDREDPMDAAERQRLRRIEELQGNSFFIGRLARLATANPGDPPESSVRAR